MSTNLDPGIYKATVRGVPDVIVFIDGAHYGRTAEYVAEHREHLPIDITDARRLIVLDVDDVPRLAYAVRCEGLTAIADQIEAQTRPPRIGEPGLWGVVEASWAEAEAMLTLLQHLDGSRIADPEQVMDDVRVLHAAAGAIPHGGALPLDEDTILETLELVRDLADGLYDDEPIPYRPVQTAPTGDVL